MIENLTIKEYADLVGKTKEAILYQIKKGKLKAEKNNKGTWIIFNKASPVLNKDNQKSDTIENHELISKIKLLELELELKEKEFAKELNYKDELLNAKDKLIQKSEQTIEAEQRTNMALTHNLRNMEKLQLENEAIKKRKRKKFLGVF